MSQMDMNFPWYYWLIPAIPAILLVLALVGAAFGIGWVLGNR